MPLKNPFRQFLVVLGFAFCALTAAAQTPEIKCALELRDRMLDVRLELPAEHLERTSFALSDWGGQPNYADNIYRVAARDAAGRELKVEKTGARAWTVANGKKRFTLSYAVVSPKETFMGTSARNHFHPTIFGDYAFLWGATFLLFPDDPALGARPAALVVAPHEYGTAHTNFAGRAASFNDLGDLFVAAGDYRVAPRQIGGRTVKFLLRGRSWKFSDEEFIDKVTKIMEAQVRYMGFSAATDDLLVTLTEGTPESRGGTVVRNVISVYPNPQTGIDDFDTLRLIAHEHFHFWNGTYWKASTGKKEGYYKWMSEGFTEYYAGLTLYRENLVTEKQFVAWLNELLFQYQTNRHALTATAAVLEENYWASQDYNRLPYVKGALVALLTDVQLKERTQGKKSVDDLMRLLMKNTDRTKGYDDQTLIDGFAGVLEAGATNAPATFNRQVYDDFMLGAKPLPVASVLAASAIPVAETAREVFDLGFTTDAGKLERGARVLEVTTPAAREAGLKPGDELRGMSFRYGQLREEASFTFQRGAETVAVKYFPKKTVTIWQLDENARPPR